MHHPPSKTPAHQKPTDARPQVKAYSLNTRQTQQLNKFMAIGLASLLLISFIQALISN